MLLKARAAWVHDFNNDHSVAAAFQLLPGSSFTLGGRFDGEFSSGSNVYSETVILKHQW